VRNWYDMPDVEPPKARGDEPHITGIDMPESGSWPYLG